MYHVVGRSYNSQKKNVCPQRTFVVLSEDEVFFFFRPEIKFLFFCFPGSQSSYLGEGADVSGNFSLT